MVLLSDFLHRPLPHHCNGSTRARAAVSSGPAALRRKQGKSANVPRKCRNHAVSTGLVCVSQIWNCPWRARCMAFWLTSVVQRSCCSTFLTQAARLCDRGSMTAIECSLDRSGRSQQIGKRPSKQRLWRITCVPVGRRITWPPRALGAEVDAPQ